MGAEHATAAHEQRDCFTVWWQRAAKALIQQQASVIKLYVISHIHTTPLAQHLPGQLRGCHGRSVVVSHTAPSSLVTNSRLSASSVAVTRA